jgi:hypothetical protein
MHETCRIEETSLRSVNQFQRMPYRLIGDLSVFQDF